MKTLALVLILVLFKTKNKLTKRKINLLFHSAIPLAPGAPTVKDWSERHMALEWKEPIDDGGLPITGYHVEAKANNGEDWQLCEVIDTPVTRATVQGIQQGIEYQFRVIAITKAGKSEPSLPSRAKEARAQRRE